jgi:hypothetical protein
MIDRSWGCDFSSGTQKVLVFLLVAGFSYYVKYRTSGVFSLARLFIMEEVQLDDPVRGKREVYIHFASST